MTDHCTACKVSFTRAFHAPMLTDATWSKLANRDENLCAECFWTRAGERRVRLTLADLKPCPVNLFHQPYSWFDLFAKGERPEIIEAWLKFADNNQTAWEEKAEQARRRGARRRCCGTSKATP
jgi:hypothetical protein